MVRHMKESRSEDKLLKLTTSIDLDRIGIFGKKKKIIVMGQNLNNLSVEIDHFKKLIIEDESDKFNKLKKDFEKYMHSAIEKFKKTLREETKNRDESKLTRFLSLFTTLEDTVYTLIKWLCSSEKQIISLSQSTRNITCAIKNETDLVNSL